MLLAGALGRFNLNPAVGAEQLGIGKISFRLLRASQAACNRRGGSSWRPLRYLTRARLRMRYHRSRSVNCSAVSRRVAEKAAMRVSARRARSRSPWELVVGPVARPAWLVCSAIA